MEYRKEARTAAQAVCVVLAIMAGAQVAMVIAQGLRSYAHYMTCVAALDRGEDLSVMVARDCARVAGER